MSYKDKKRLAAYKRNPHYFEYDGKPIWLSGHSRLWPLAGWIPPTNRAVDNPPADTGRHLPPPGRTYRDEVTRISESGGHLTRITPFYPYNWKRGNPLPWKQVKSGKFDLTQWDADFFEALGDFLSSCAENDIIVQLEIWDRPGISHFTPTRWATHPMNPDNNVNYGTDVLPATDGAPDIAFGQRLFYATARGENPELLEYQRAYFAKLLEVAAPLPNIIYCIDNEGTGGIEWEQLWAGAIRQAVPDAMITAMPLEAEDHTYQDYFNDENLNCLDGGGTALRYATLNTVGKAAGFEQKHERFRYDRIVIVREAMAKYYLLMSTEAAKKRPIFISNCFGRVLDSIWTVFCSGGAGLRYHRNTWDETEEVYGWVRAFNDFLAETGAPFAEMAPANHRLRGHGLCLANEQAAVVYLPTDYEVSLQMPSGTQQARVRMFDCARGEWASDQTVTPATASGAGKDLLIYLQAKTDVGTAAYVEVV